MLAEEKARLRDAFAEWGADLWRAVYAFSGRRAEIADEAVAEAFAQAAIRLGSIRDLRAWVFKVAFRTAAHELKGVGSLNPGQRLQR